MDYIGTFITLSAIGNGSKIGSIRFENDSLQGNVFQDIGQRRFLVSKHPAYTQCEPLEGEQFPRLLTRSAKTMEYARKSIIAMPLHDIHQLPMGRTGMNYQWQTQVARPANLPFKRQYLRCPIGLVPVEVKSHFADGYIGRGWRKELLPQMGKDFFIVSAHILGMKAHHGPAVTGIATTEVEHRFYSVRIDIREEHVLHSGLTGTGDHLLTVLVELWAIDMTVSVYQRLKVMGYRL